MYRKIICLFVALLVLVTVSPINANEMTPVREGLIDKKTIKTNENEVVEIIPIEEDDSVFIIDYVTDSFRAIFTLKNMNITRIDYLDLTDGKIYSKTIHEPLTKLLISSQNKIDLKLVLQDVTKENGWNISEYVNVSFNDTFESLSVSQDSNESKNTISSTSAYHNAVLSSFNSYAGNNYYALLRSTQNYKGHTGRVYETATNQVSRRWNLDAFFNAKTVLSVIALYLGWPVATVKQAISFGLGAAGVLETLYKNEVQDWNGKKYYQKDVEVNSKVVTWKTYAELRTKAILLTDPIKGASISWTHIEKVFFDGQSVYNDNTGLIIKGVDNFICLGY